MKLSHLFFLFTTLVLASCGNKGIPGIPGITDDGNLITTISEEQTNSWHTEYVGLLDIVERIRVFNEEEEEYLQNPTFDKVEKYSPEAIAAIRKHLATHSEFVETLYEKTLQLLKGEQDINEYLFTLLAFRFDYLKSRHEFIAQSLHNATPEGLYMYPTSKELFELLMKDESCSDKIHNYNESVRLYTVSRFELLNLLIKESLATCTVAELKQETIYLLRASKQLHPILTGERKDLGHPDEAGGPYAILESIVLQPSKKTPMTVHGEKLNKLLEAPFWKKNARYNTKYANRQFLDFLVNRISHYEEMRNDKAINYIPKAGLLQFKNLGTPSGDGIRITEEQERAAKINQELSSMKIELDVEIFNALFVLQEGVLSKKLTLQGSPSLVTDDGAKKWLYELPDPEFLKPQQVEEPIDGASFFGDLEKEDKKQAYLPSTSIRSDNNSEITLAAPPVEKKEVKQATQTYPAFFEKELSSENESTEKEEITEPSVDLQPTMPTGGANGVPAEQPASTFSFTRDWVLPHGLRSFHGQMLRFNHPILSLNVGHQYIVDRLFDPHQQCNVTFKEFKILWKAAKGKIIGSHGGSHKQLIGPNEEPLFGIFAHGNNQTYRKNYVQYLQTAVLYIGLRPAQGLDKLANNKQPRRKQRGISK